MISLLEIKAWLGCMLLLASSSVNAQERSVAPGLLLSGHFESRGTGTGIGQNLPRIGSDWVSGPELGVSVPYEAGGNELKLSVKRSGDVSRIDWSLNFGHRGYFGEDTIRTFWDIDVTWVLSPKWSLGPRVALGLQYDLLPWLSAFGLAGLQVGFGNELRYNAGIAAGLQIRLPRSIF